MNKAQLIEKVAKKSSLTKVQTEKILDITLSVIQSSVTKGEDVKIVGFGVFDQILRKSRNIRNPQNGETISVPASKAPRFRPGKAFKEKVNKINL